MWNKMYTSSVDISCHWKRYVKDAARQTICRDLLFSGIVGIDDIDDIMDEREIWSSWENRNVTNIFYLSEIALGWGIMWEIFSACIYKLKMMLHFSRDIFLYELIYDQT